MEWRTWVWNALAPLETPVHQGGSLDRRPTGQDHFVVVTFMPSLPGPFTGSEIQRVQVWAHDTHRSYVRIDRTLQAVRALMRAQPSEEAFISANWEGESNDLQDDAMETRARYAMFRLSARDDT